MTAPRKRDANDVVPHRVELAGQTVAGGIGSAYGAAKLRDAYKSEHPEKFRSAIRRSAVRASRAGVPHPKIVSAAKVAHAGKPPFAALVTLTGAGGVAAAAHHYQQINDWSKKRKEQVGALVKTSAIDVPAGPGQRTVGPKVRVRVTPPARHAQKPYAGKHRTLSPLDNVKATAMLHSKHLASAAEGIADLFKSVCYRCAELVPGEARYAQHATLGKVQILGHHGNGQVHVLDRADQGRVVHQDTLRFQRKKGSTMAKSGFGVDIAKAGGDEAAKALKALKFAKPKPGVKPTGPGSKRAQMSPRAWESQTAAAGRGGKVEKAHVLRDIAAVGGAAGAGALLAKPKLAADVVKATQSRVVKPFARAYRNPAGGGRPMPGPGGLGKSYGPDELLKASAFGSSGDKRNTKYAGAAYGGAALGGAVGRQVATRTAGTSVRDVGALARTHMADKAPEILEHNASQHLAGMTGHESFGRQVKAGLKFGRANAKGLIGSVKDVPGGARMLRGGKAGAITGAVGGTAAYAAHRHHKGVAKSAFLEKADTKQKPPSAGRVAAGTVFSGLHGAAAGKKGKKLKAAGSEVGHSIGGSVLGSVPGAVLRKPALAVAGSYGGAYGGAATGVYANQRKGRYKRES